MSNTNTNKKINCMFKKSIIDDNLELFSKIIKYYNFNNFYKIYLTYPNTNLKFNYGFTILGIVIKACAYKILIYLLDKLEINLNKFSKIYPYFSDDIEHIYTPLYQILSAKNNKIEENCLELCKKLLNRGVSLNNNACIYYFNNDNGNNNKIYKTGKVVVEMFHKDKLNALIEYEANLKK